MTRRITRAAAEIALGLREELTLGSLEAVRDWSFAGDIVRGAWLMLQQERPDDYVLASGVAHTVAEFAAAAFACVDLDAERYLRVDPRSCAPRSAPRASAIRAARASVSAGSRRSLSRSSSSAWCGPTCGRSNRTNRRRAGHEAPPRDRDRDSVGRARTSGHGRDPRPWAS